MKEGRKEGRKGGRKEGREEGRKEGGETSTVYVTCKFKSTKVSFG